MADWEIVFIDEKSPTVSRFRVPGGWLYYVHDDNRGHLVFVPEP